MSGYDDALFYQKVRQQARFGKVRAADVEAAFWAVAWDLRLAIQQQNPDKMDAAEETFRREMLSVFATQIKKDLGIEVIGLEVNPLNAIVVKLLCPPAVMKHHVLFVEDRDMGLVGSLVDLAIVQQHRTPLGGVFTADYFCNLSKDQEERLREMVR